jgi:hypothetical protein
MQVISTENNNLFSAAQPAITEPEKIKAKQEYEEVLIV